MWNKTFGGQDYDKAESVCQTFDGGYIVVGWTDSYGAGSRDAWLVKIDADGNEIWNETFGDKRDDFGCSVIQTSDNSYVIAGVYSHHPHFFDFFRSENYDI